jgi:hypothetical protein
LNKQNTQLFWNDEYVLSDHFLPKVGVRVGHFNNTDTPTETSVVHGTANLPIGCFLKRSLKSHLLICLFEGHLLNNYLIKDFDSFEIRGAIEAADGIELAVDDG